MVRSRYSSVVFTITAILLLIIVTSCELPRSSLAGTRWKLASIEHGGRSEHVISKQGITAEFTNGMLRGVSGCNTYGSEFTVNGNRLTVKDVIETQMGCGNQQESEYWHALNAATSFTLTSDTLTITYAGGTLHFARM